MQELVYDSSNPVLKIVCHLLYNEIRLQAQRCSLVFGNGMHRFAEPTCFLISDNEFSTPPSTSLWDEIHIVMEIFQRVASQHTLVGTFSFSQDARYQIPQRAWKITFNCEKGVDQLISELNALCTSSGEEVERALETHRASGIKAEVAGGFAEAVARLRNALKAPTLSLPNLLCSAATFIEMQTKGMLAPGVGVIPLHLPPTKNIP